MQSKGSGQRMPHTTLPRPKAMPTPPGQYEVHQVLNTQEQAGVDPHTSVAYAQTLSEYLKAAGVDDPGVNSDTDNEK